MYDKRFFASSSESLVLSVVLISYTCKSCKIYHLINISDFIPTPRKNRNVHIYIWLKIKNYNFNPTHVDASILLHEQDVQCKKLYSQTFQNLNPVHEFYNTVHLYMTVYIWKMDPRNIVYV